MKTVFKSDLSISLEHISVHYRSPEERIGTLKEYAIRFLQQRVHYKEFLALHDISLEIFQGDIFGFIGRNGAGKSTLLKVISRVLIPTHGRVWIKGRVSPLLELGAGFHPELTGIENVFLNGTLLGHSRSDIEDHLDEITEFAELGAFIDAPIRTYSSGMLARLGFAVATSWIPEVLLLDEVLSVGDEAFRRKCQLRMEDFRSKGTTTILVTHDLNSARTLCSKIAWLDAGTLKLIGEPDTVIKSYQGAIAG